jgi:hypothetical protein
MHAMMALSSDSRTTSGVLLITIVAVEYGGLFVLRLVRGAEPATEFQKSFARAGHAHAGVLVIFAIVAQPLADATGLHGFAEPEQPKRNVVALARSARLLGVPAVLTTARRRSESSPRLAAGGWETRRRATNIDWAAVSISRWTVCLNGDPSPGEEEHPSCSVARTTRNKS